MKEIVLGGSYPCPKCGVRSTSCLRNKCNCNKIEEKLKNVPCEATTESNPLLADVRAVLENIVDGEYRLFHSDSMDQDTGLEEEIKNLYKKVSEHFS